MDARCKAPPGTCCKHKTKIRRGTWLDVRASNGLWASISRRATSANQRKREKMEVRQKMKNDKTAPVIVPLLCLQRRFIFISSQPFFCCFRSSYACPPLLLLAPFFFFFFFFSFLLLLSCTTWVFEPAGGVQRSKAVVADNGQVRLALNEQPRQGRVAANAAVVHDGAAVRALRID